jgi:site-specific recombinase XerD
MRKIFKLAGPWEESAHPHRFRATFARILPQNGVEIQDVAELIGDTPAIVAKHYAKWVTVRQDRLRRILQEAFDDKPKPKIVAIR